MIPPIAIATPVTARLVRHHASMVRTSAKKVASDAGE
jgi:hypothetical protein